MSLGVLGLVVASLAVLGAATAFAAAMPRRGTLVFLAAVGLLSWAIVVVTVGFAGLVLRMLTGPTLLVLALGWAVAGLAVAWRRRELGSWPRRARLAIAALVPIGRWVPVLVGLVLFAASLAWRSFLALRLPVVDYDGWSYHLVFVDVWLQHQALVPVLQRPWTAGYPADAELLTTWLAAFPRNDAFTGLTSLLPIPLGVVGTMGLARTFGAGRGPAALAGLVFGMTPALVGLSGTTYVDAASVAAVVVALWLGLLVVRGQRGASMLLLLGIAVGLAAGTKGTNVLLVGPIGAVAGLLLLRELIRRRGEGTGIALLRLATLVVPVAVLGLSWYLKNVLAFGNPLYPFALGPLPGVTTLADFQLTAPQLEGRGLLGSILSSWIWDWQIQHYAYNVRPGGLGRAWPVILVLGTVGLGLVLRRRRYAAALLIVVPAVITLLVMPMAWYARLTLFLPAIGLGLSAVALEALARRLRLVAALGLVAVAAISLVLVNVRPNVDLRPQDSSTTSVSRYLRLLAAGEARRTDIALRADCSEFDQIPAGSRVAPGGFNLLHAIVGPELSRELTESVVLAAGPEDLLAQVQAFHATWLVTSVGGPIDRVAVADPGHFADRGQSCGSAHLFELVGGG